MIYPNTKTKYNYIKVNIYNQAAWSNKIQLGINKISHSIKLPIKTIGIVDWIIYFLRNNIINECTTINLEVLGGLTCRN